MLLFLFLCLEMDCSCYCTLMGPTCETPPREPGTAPSRLCSLCPSAEPSTRLTHHSCSSLVSLGLFLLLFSLLFLFLYLEMDCSCYYTPMGPTCKTPPREPGTAPSRLCFFLPFRRAVYPAYPPLLQFFSILGLFLQLSLFLFLFLPLVV